MSSIHIDTFRTLFTQYPTWPDLKACLEGEHLRVIEQAGGYAVIRYGKKGATTPLAGTFRSVIWNTVTNRPVCVAPPKACEGMPPTGVRLRINELVDGCMVNAFVDPISGNLVVATRTQVGGDNTFYGSKTFGQMFDESLATTPLKGRAGIAAVLAGARFASFVVQHPEHRIVAKVSRPSLKLVHMGSIDDDGVVHILGNPAEWPEAFRGLAIEAAEKEYASVEEIQETMRRMAVQEGWRWQGLSYSDEEGRRWRLRSPTYTMLRELRGGEGAAVDRFLRLRREGKVGEYLKHYGEDRQLFWGYEAALRAATGSVLAAYADCHKTHKVTFKGLPDAFKPAVYILHVKWLQELRPKGFSVRQQNAVEVVNSLRPFEQRRLLEAGVYIPSTEPPKQRASAVFGLVVGLAGGVREIGEVPVGVEEGGEAAQ